jgi:hypothetical protein
MQDLKEITRKPLRGQKELFPVKSRPEPVEINGQLIDPPVKPNAMRCPKCRAETRVRCTRPPFRYRYCQGCGFSYRTQEVVQADADALIGLVATVMGGLNECGISGDDSER